MHQICRLGRLLALALFAPGLLPGQARGDLPRPRQFIFFGLDRERIREPGFLDVPAIAGAQLKYTWRELEPEPGEYRFDGIRADLDFLRQHGKQLAIQVQDVSFDGSQVLVPEYLRADSLYHGGIARQYLTTGDDDATATPEGWVARRWDAAVRARFGLLLGALGRAFDGQLAAVTLPETAVDFGTSGRLWPQDFTPAGYAGAIKAQMRNARAAFPRTPVIQYANFMPGEWLPDVDRGYLRGIYAEAARLGVGVGGPDLMPHRPGQLAHSYPLIAHRPTGELAGVAVQDGNLADVNPATGRRVSVRELAGYARDTLRLDFIFWGTEEPYYTDEVLPYLKELGARPDRLRGAASSYYRAATRLYLSPWFYLLVGVILLLEVWHPAIKRQRVLSRALLEDFGWFNLDLLFRVSALPLFVAGLEWLWSRWTGGFALTTLSSWPLGWKVAASFLVLDFLAWGHHWVRHKVAAFWQFHVIHHSQRELNLFTDLRIHWGEYLIAQTLIFVPMFVFALEPFAIMSVGFAAQWYTRLVHANVRTNFGPLRYLLVTPQSHRIHHSIEPQHRDRNFGVFLSVWDRAFGTQWPGADEYPETGVAGVTFDQDSTGGRIGLARSFAREFAYPFRRWWPRRRPAR
jgi:sterol desaturase/sphingolipid hydroxylase (fatty acid hydroxylase superfamily)